MRFFKRFSFRHRRTKSDSAAMPDVVPQTHLLVRSYSGEQLITESYSLAHSHNGSEEIHTVISPNPLPFPSASEPHQLVATHQIRSLEAKVNDLILANHEWARDCNQLQRQVQSGQFVGADSAAGWELKLAQTEVKRLEEKLAHYERFLGLMVNIGLHELVLDKALAALKGGSSADAALVDAIKEAASKPGSAWATIMPAIVGPRSPEQYIAAINLAAKLRKDLKDSRRIAGFWKKRAKENDLHANVITPSVSMLSDIHEPLSLERQKAVDHVLEKRGIALPGPDPTSPSRIFKPAVPTIPSRSSSIQTMSSIADESREALHISSSSSVVEEPSSGYSLPPLASESFHQELATLANAGRLFRRSSKSSTSSSLGEHEVNSHKGSFVLPRSDSGGSRLSGKASLQRKHVPSTQSTDSVKASSLDSGLATCAFHDSFNVSTTDIFASILTDSLLKARGAPLHKEPKILRPDSVDAPPFDNSAFCALVEPSRPVPNVYHETVYLETISEESETLCPHHFDMDSVAHQQPSPSLSGRNEGGDTDVSSEAPTQDSMINSCSIRNQNAFFDSGAVSTASTTPERDKSSAAPLGKISRLPVLKRIRRLSQGISAKVTPPLVIQKKGKGKTYALSVPIVTSHSQNRKLASISPAIRKTDNPGGNYSAISRRNVARRLSLVLS